MKIMKQRKLKKLCCLSFVALLLGMGFSSCSFPRIYLDLVNQTSSPVWISFPSPIYALNTRRHEIKSGLEERIDFPVPNPQSKKAVEKLSRKIPFFCFATPTDSVRFEGPEEVMKIFSLKGDEKDSYKFFITDSLFASKE